MRGKPARNERGAISSGSAATGSGSEPSQLLAELLGQASVTEEFLEFSVERGNDLVTPVTVRAERIDKRVRITVSDAGLRCRPMLLERLDEDGTLLFLTHLSSQKVEELSRDPRVNLAFDKMAICRARTVEPEGCFAARSLPFH